MTTADEFRLAYKIGIARRPSDANIRIDDSIGTACDSQRVLVDEYHQGKIPLSRR